VASAGLYASLHLILDNHANIPPLSFYRPDALPAAQSDQAAIQKRAIRIIFSTTYDIPYASALYTANLPALAEQRDQLCHNFFTTVLEPSSCLHHILQTNLVILSYSLSSGYPQNIPEFPPEPKNINCSYILHWLLTSNQSLK